MTLLAYGLWKERQKEEAAEKEKEVNDSLDNVELSGEEEEEKDAEIEDIEKALAELKENELGKDSPEELGTPAITLEDNTKDGKDVESENIAEQQSHPPLGETFHEGRNKSRSRSITTKTASRSPTRSRSRGTSRVRERSRGSRKTCERRSGSVADRSKIEMVKLKIEKRIQREEKRRRMREEEFHHQPRHHHQESHHHRYFPNPDHYPRYDDEDYYGPPGPPFHGEYRPLSPGYSSRQHGKAGGGGYCQERPGGFHEKGYLEKGYHEKSFHPKPFYPPPLPPPTHLHYQRFPTQHY